MILYQKVEEMWAQMKLPLICSTGTEGFPCGSAGKESACSAGDPSSIPGSGRSAGEGIRYPFWCWILSG